MIVIRHKRTKMDQNKCMICPKDVHCCKFSGMKGFVFLGMKNAEDISKRTKLKLDSFSEFRKMPKNMIQKMRSEPYYSEAHLRLSLMKGGKLLVLKTRSNGDCIFLEDRRCRIYRSRPLICRIYPYWFMDGEKGKKHVICMDERCRNAKSEQGKAMLGKREEKDVLRLAKEIMEESKHYKRGIDVFIKEQCLVSDRLKK